jgi:hypothetical protein
MVPKRIDYKERFRTAAYTEKWAVTMTKVRIRQAVAHAPFPRWHFVGFAGRDGGESRGVVDLIAVRKNHALPREGLKRGDTLQIVLIQVKGGYAAHPTTDDGKRLRTVAKLHHAHGILLASWKKGAAARFYTLRPRAKDNETDWLEVEDLKTIFC